MSTAVITGSTRGLGFEMAKLFHREGWDLVLNGTNPERLQKAVEQLRALPGGRVEGKTGSVASGEELQALLRKDGIACEFADRRYLVLMPSAETTEEAWQRLLKALRAVPRREALKETPPPLPVPEKALSVREAMLSPQETLPADKAVGRILADACVSCPPAVPVVIAGERITPAAAACMAYYGMDECNVVKNA